MLVDPKWQKPKVNADIYSVESLIAWLEEQSANKSFCLVSALDCGLTQYLKAMGCPYPVEKSVLLGNRTTLFGRIFGLDGTRRWSTFGEALERARAILAERQS